MQYLVFFLNLEILFLPKVHLDGPTRIDTVIPKMAHIKGDEGLI